MFLNVMLTGDNGNLIMRTCLNFKKRKNERKYMIGENNSNYVLYNDYLKSFLSANNMKLNRFRITHNNHQENRLSVFI